MILATKNKEGTVGTSFHGVKNNILSPDPESGEGEIIVSSRAVFMGYVKVSIKIHGVLKQNIFVKLFVKFTCDIPSLSGRRKD